MNLFVSLSVRSRVGAVQLDVFVPERLLAAPQGRKLHTEQGLDIQSCLGASPPSATAEAHAAGISHPTRCAAPTVLIKVRMLKLVEDQLKDLARQRGKIHLTF